MVLSARYQLRYDPVSLFRATGFTAGPDQVRLAELQAALRDPQARAVIMGRGGYGLFAFWPAWMPTCFGRQPNPSWILRRTLLLAQAARAGLASIHGPVVTQLGACPARITRPSSRRWNSRMRACYFGIAGAGHRPRDGSLLGGNLEVFSRMLGTPYLPDLRGAILFFEDVGERPYRLDRLLTQMELAGFFRARPGWSPASFAIATNPRAPSCRRRWPARCCASGWAAEYFRGSGRARRPRPEQPRLALWNARRAGRRRGHAGCAGRRSNT